MVEHSYSSEDSASNPCHMILIHSEPDQWNMKYTVLAEAGRTEDWKAYCTPDSHKVCNTTIQRNIPYGCGICKGTQFI